MSHEPKIHSACWTSLRSAMLAFTRDWRHRRMPQLFWGEQRLPIHDIRLLPPVEYALQSGYFFREGICTFVMPAEAYPQFDWKLSGLFVAGDFNEWTPAGKAQWRLEPALVRDKEYWMLSVPQERVFKRSAVMFKFVTGRGEWLEVRSDAPNAIQTPEGHHNLRISPHRGGLHQFSFTAPEPINRTTQAVVHFVDGDHSESILLHPGSFLLKLGTNLPLGAIVEQKATTFRLFAPRASAAKVVFHNPDSPDKEQRLEMRLVDECTWQAKHPANLHGWHYHYQVSSGSCDGFSHFRPDAKILDPWALACLGPTGPGIIIDKTRYTKPKPYPTPWWHDLVVCEAHVRDLIAKAPIPLEPDERRTFSGLRKFAQSKGFYLKELGVNAVELQPIQQNDAKTREEYHWGYMTCNFFAPNSHYSTDPANASGLTELRELVDALHEQGLAVILDVVYNHVGEPNHLQYLDKYYWFELAPDGSYMNWSGCGNDLRCDTQMARRLIIESLTHLVEFYGVDGFRFDLAELIGIETLRIVEEAIKKVKPSVILIAEPWSFRGHIGFGLKTTGFASWNDGYRDFLAKYVRGEGGFEGIAYFLAGSMGHLSAWPAQSVNYSESHDDRCWLDKITENGDGNGHHLTTNDRRRTHLMLATLMMSIGIPMLSAGQDFLRSKYGHNNTYLEGDINALDYARTLEYPATTAYARAWVAFRRSPLAQALRLYRKPSPQYLSIHPAQHGNGFLALYNANHEVQGSTLLFALNPHTSAAAFDVALPYKNWLQIADSERFNEAGLTPPLLPIHEGKITLPPLSCALWRERG